MRGTKLKKLTAVFISVIMTVSCAACGFHRRQEWDAHEDDENYITCMVWDRDNLPEGRTFDDNTLAEWIRQEVLNDCGVEVHFASIKRNDSDEVVRRLVEDGNAPDIVITYSPSLFGYLTEQDKVADLTDSLKQYGENITKNISDIQYMGQYKDQQVAIMKRRGFQMPRHVAFIRSDWCRAMGMEIPSTKAELIDYLYALKKNNPGNVDGLVPWAMGGTLSSEKYYQNFVSSYVGELSERDSYIYSERFVSLADGASDGLKVLNTLYNDGIISLDFAADKDNEQYYKDVEEGKAGFFIDDNTALFGAIAKIKESDPAAEIDPVMCFDLPDGGYRNICEPVYGLYIMVPSTSKNKVDSVMKYLNWLADQENAINVCFTPDHRETADGAPVGLSDDELLEKGYSTIPDDYCIVNEHFDYVDNKEQWVSANVEELSFADREWLEKYYDVCTTGQFVFPVNSLVGGAETKYRTDLDKRIVEYNYNLICCPKTKFDTVKDMEYRALQDAGLDEVLEERAQFYDSGEFKNGK